jgi:hypothetical protein
MIALASALTGFAFTPVIAAEREQVRSRACKRRPSFEGQFLLSGSPHGRHQSAVSPRAPGLDSKEADGVRPGDTVNGGPEFDAFEHLDRETDFDFGAYGCVNGGHVSPSIVDVGFEDEMKCAKLRISRLLELQVAPG